MLTQTITAPAVPAAKVFPAPRAQTVPVVDQFSVIATCAGVIASEFSYRKDEEIYGEGEPSEYVYQVIRGAVRTYKLLNDGRRQIGAFHPPGGVFGLDAGSTHRLTAEAIADTTVRLVKRQSHSSATRAFWYFRPPVKSCCVTDNDWQTWTHESISWPRGCRKEGSAR
jgi:CRP/FNR family transcriptional regulator, nitrogen fixation regulation protein